MTDFRSLMTRREGLFGGHNRFDAGKYQMSVQCDSHHYCDPRVPGLPLDSYTAMEVAIFKNDQWEPIVNLKGLIPEDIRQQFECADTPVDQWVNGVAGYMSIADIQRLYDALCVIP